MSNTITSPGKFEGEPEWAPHFWDLSLDGTADYVTVDDQDWYIVPVEQEDIDRWPDLASVHSVALTESTAGFVCTHLIMRGYNSCAVCGTPITDAMTCDYDCSDPAGVAQQCGAHAVSPGDCFGCDANCIMVRDSNG